MTGSDGYLVGLWMHECRRVLGDRMVSLEDQAWTAATVNDVAECVAQIQHPCLV